MYLAHLYIPISYAVDTVVRLVAGYCAAAFEIVRKEIWRSWHGEVVVGDQEGGEYW